jgi:hypothetical protein
MASMVGGLAGARDLSLVLMLGATICVFGAGRKVFGVLAGLLAAGLFATAAPTLFLGQFATFDALASFALALASWLVCESADRVAVQGWAITLAAGGVAGYAVLAKYTTLILLPGLVAMTALTTARRTTWQRAAGRTAVFTLGAAVPIFLCLELQPLVLRGFRLTMLSRGALGIARAQVSAPIPTVVGHSIWYIGGILALAVLGLVGLVLQRAPHKTQLLGLVLLLSGLAVTVGEARLHTLVSLFKQDDFGLGFSAILAGEGVAFLIRRWKGRAVLPTAVGLAILLTFSGGTVAGDMGWPSEAGIVQYLGKIVHPGSERYLADDASILQYYLEDRTSEPQWVSTSYFSFDDPVRHQQVIGPEAYKSAIDIGYFHLVLLNSAGPQLGLDRALTREMAASRRYRLVTRVASHKGSQEYWLVYEAVGRGS